MSTARRHDAGAEGRGDPGGDGQAVGQQAAEVLQAGRAEGAGRRRAAAAHHPARPISRRSSPSSRPSSPKARDCSIPADRMDTILNESLSPEEINALMGVEPAGGGAGRAAAGLAGRREARSGAARRVPGRGASADRGARAVEAVAVGRGERAADARQGGAQRNRQAHDVDGGRYRRSRQASSRSRLRGAAARRKRDAGHVGRPDPRRQRAQRDGQGQARRGHAGPRSVRRAAISQALRSRLFAFEDVMLLTQKARVALFDSISTELVTLALRNAPPALAEAVLSSIGARSRRMIESELGQGADSVNAGGHRAGAQGDRGRRDPHGARGRVRTADRTQSAARARVLTISHGGRRRQGQQNRRGHREEDPRHDREGPAAALARNRRSSPPSSPS